MRSKVVHSKPLYNTIIQKEFDFYNILIYVLHISQYMHENENKVYIDVNEMADALQKRYRDYRGKKRGTFRAMVRKAYDELTEIFSRKPATRECAAYDDDDFEDVDVEVYSYYIFNCLVFYNIF